MNKYPPANADATLEPLREGNERYRTKGLFHQVDRERRNELQTGQSPIAAMPCTRLPQGVIVRQRIAQKKTALKDARFFVQAKYSYSLGTMIHNRK